VYWTTSEFDRQIVPLVRRMSYLKTFSLSLCVLEKSLSIDGIYLPHPETLNFNIVPVGVDINRHTRPSSDDI
ncbi:hypothetical protein, partial [Corallococcus sp. AB038B]|uniref:hypothetical protein n=1 Tax=Corallococcus sp. AB038B TaxID=2316718 RepID=UPI001F254640